MTEQNNGWVSVDERLPKEGREVLIAVRNGRDYYISKVTYQKYFGKMKWVEPNYDYYGIEDVVLDLHKASYWQCLPPPPPPKEGNL